MINTLIDEMKKVFAADQKRISHSMKVLNYARQIQMTEGGDFFVVQAAAILHDIGIHQAERKYGSSAGKYQQIEGPPIARDILSRNNVSPEAIEHICKIIASHHIAKDIDTLEFKIVWDADRLVNIQEKLADINSKKGWRFINRIFKTRKGREIAKELFIGSDE